jgi:hypothetical protein
MFSANTYEFYRKYNFIVVAAVVAQLPEHLLRSNLLEDFYKIDFKSCCYCLRQQLPI